MSLVSRPWRNARRSRAGKRSIARDRPDSTIPAPSWSARYCSGENMAALLLFCADAVPPLLYRCRSCSSSARRWRQPPRPRRCRRHPATGDAVAHDLRPRRRGRADAVERRAGRHHVGDHVHRAIRRRGPQPLRDEVRRRLAADRDAAGGHAGAAPARRRHVVRSHDRRERDHAERRTTSSKTDQVSARTVVLPNNFYALYEALAVRLAASAPGAEIPLYVAPQGEVKLPVKGDQRRERSRRRPARCARASTRSSIQNVGANVDAVVAVDGRNRFARARDARRRPFGVRSDLGGRVGARARPCAIPTDGDVHDSRWRASTSPARMTMPKGEGRLRHPTVVLVGGSGPADRDETVAGIPDLRPARRALAERGFMVLRYDKRGVGQSGGRTETVTLAGLRRRLVAIVKWLAKRDDVDPRRIAVAGHSEGGAVAMLAAAREKQDRLARARRRVRIDRRRSDARTAAAPARRA